VAREIFESGSLASQGLDRHLKAEGTGVWGQLAVRGANQDAISQSVDGYDSDQTVFTIGGDLMLGDATRVGLMASYADIGVQDETATGSQTNDQDVESIRLGFYMSTTLFDRGFVNTEFSYITGEVDTARSGVLGSVSSSYDFDGFASRSVFGYDLLADENISLTPTVGINAMEINFDDALEAGGFGFTVQQGDARFVEARFGAELGAQVSEKVSGFVQGTVVHDLIDTQRSLRLTSNELPTFAISQPVREQDRFELAAGASIDVTDSFAIEIGYLGDFNEGYQGHSGRASVRIAF
ncbi:MAG: autotransporter outer membrane beta-barrel domain-containing protein, partial [Pseudomonadota bacterium]